MNNKELTLSILITTMNDWIHRVKKELLPQLNNADEVIISHQITDKNIKPENKPLWKNVKYFFMHDKWVSKNRNNAIKHATWDICHICDDDISFVKGFEEIIKKAYDKNNKADLITFQRVTNEWEHWKSNYKTKQFTHNNISILYLSSIEVTFRLSYIKKHNLLFNEVFGLWAKYWTWEENIFLKKCLDKKWKLIYLPIPLIIHPIETSSDSRTKELMIAKKNVFKEMYWKVLWTLLYIMFVIVKYPKYKWKVSLFSIY